MSDPRTFAAAEAWPLVSDVPRLRPSDVDRAVDDLVPRARGTSMDQLRMLVRRAWWGEQVPADQSLHGYLRTLAGRYLRDPGDGCQLAVPGDETDGKELSRLAERFRFLTWHLPQELLLAAVPTLGPHPPTGRVEVLPSLVRRLLADGGLAETHLHLTAATEFRHLWTGLMVHARVRPARTRRDAADVRKRRSGILAAAALRLVLAAELHGDGLAGRAPAQWSSAWATWRDQLDQGPLPAPDPAHRELLRWLEGGLRPRPRCTTVGELHRADPLSRWWPSTVCDPETSFLRAGIDHLFAGADPTFEARFWRYVRLRGGFYRHLTQDPGVRGLDWFSLHMDRIKELWDRSLSASSSTFGGDRVGLVAVELRIGPPDTAREVRQKARSVAPRGGDDHVERALIVHFQRDDRATRGSALLPGRYAGFARSAARSVRALRTALRRQPELLLLIRAVDLCAAELAMPAWAALPALADVHRLAREATTIGTHRFPAWHFDPLRTTMHVGEEYCTLAQGLRHVHELVEFRVLRAGDRIGHGVSLGEAPDRWPLDHQALEPADEVLEDLIWELVLVEQQRIAASAARVAWLQGRIRELARTIYDLDDLHVGQLVEARRLRHDPDRLRRTGWPERRRWPGPSVAEKVLDLHLFDRGVRDRGGVPVVVHLDAPQIEAHRTLQRYVRGVVAAMQITVESNPSSNQLIGDLDSLDQHPSLRMNPLPDADAGEPRVLLSLNTDDPLTFATTLPDEFGHLFHALVRSGVSVSDAATWLDGVRRQGLLSRFTSPHSTDPELWRRLRPTAARE